jgi:hypothetical protein
MLFIQKKNLDQIRLWPGFQVSDHLHQIWNIKCRLTYSQAAFFVVPFIWETGQRLTVNTSPDLVTLCIFKAVAAGPLSTLPDVENMDPWHGHGKFLLLLLYEIVHPACVHVLSSATKTLLPVLAIIMPDTTTEPPALFNALYDAFVRSRVSLSVPPKGIPLFCLEQDSNTDGTTIKVAPPSKTFWIKSRRVI